MEARLRKTTSFFISNLPDSCDKSSLWKAFEHLDNLEDAFVPEKRDKAGNKFGFIKLSNVSDPSWWMEKLKEVRFEGSVIGVNLARFKRDGSKAEPPNSTNRVSVFSRLQGFSHRSFPGNSQALDVIHRHGSKSYSSVVKGVQNVSPGGAIALPPLNTEAKNCMEFKSLVREVKDIDTLNELKGLLSGITEEGLNLKYLGGLKVLLCFNSVVEAEEFKVNMVNSWEKWFSWLYIWEGIPPIFERVAWVKILGVPVCLWDRHIFNKIGERCGRLLVKSDAEASNGNFVEERVAILINSGNRFSTEFNLTWKDHNIHVWVEEISGQWCPAFLDEDCQIPGSPKLSSEFGGSVEGGDSEPSNNEDESSATCMGNSSVIKSYFPEVSLVGNEAHGNLEQCRPDCQKGEKVERIILFCLL
ncbi:putative RNA recognition motif domain, nucleotide-binding alpha-beta plait domain superfamily [Helianthus debilis subsp. tardiflorus]